MNKNLIILLLGTVAVVHLCAARPESNSLEDLNQLQKQNEFKNKLSSFMEEDLKKKNLFNDHSKVFASVYLEYYVHAREAIQESIKVYKLVIKEPFIEKLNTAYIRSEVEEFDNYVKKAESLDTKERDEFLDVLDQLYNRLDYNMDKYNITLLETPTMEDVLIGLALEKNGIVEANKKIEESFSKFLVEMFDIVDKYIANLSAENKKIETKLIDSIQKYKTLDILNQRKTFQDLFISFEIKTLLKKLENEKEQ
ncbi:uncharacterized protein LOC119689545 [Teleopsis dalmanni]|uniref:uncharacterized protein LOC119689545 n=1 Tax=Teleopsis dalmanni TaxID=139649 RepID=UPI0018CD1F39|nr:uncharacterized protein LOC119689545 [Teleopsis dalmanni]